MRKFVRHIGSTRYYSERCRCGRTKEFDCKLIVEGSKSPKKTVSWYDAEGNLERVTGDVDGEEGKNAVK